MKSGSQLFCWTLLVLLGVLPAAGQSRNTKNTEKPAVPTRPLQLQDLVDQALRSNPDIRAAELHVEAMQARIPQAKALPDPKVKVGWMGEPIPFDVHDNFPPSYRGVTASETFPFPGKLKLRGKIADRETRAAWWNYEAARRRIVSQVKVAYFQYAYFHKALAITRNNRILLEKLTKIAEARYESGKGLQQDVLKGQVELSQLLEQITILEEQQRTAAARINTLLNRSPQTPLAPPAPLEKTELGYTLQQLYSLAHANDTGIARDQRLIERDRDALALAHKSYDPDFNVSYAYQERPDLTDTQGVFVTLNIPIFYKSKQRNEVTEASRNLESDRSVQANRLTMVNYMVKQQYLAGEQASKLAVLYSQAIVPQSAQTLESSEMAYQTGKADFLTMLDNFINLLNFQVQYYREISDYQISLARLEPLVGVSIAK